MANKTKEQQEVTYYSVRTIKARSQEEAISKVEDGDFDEGDEICDIVVTAEELAKVIMPRL